MILPVLFFFFGCSICLKAVIVPCSADSAAELNKNQNQIGLSAFWKTIREIHFAAAADAVNRGSA